MTSFLITNWERMKGHQAIVVEIAAQIVFAVV